MSEAKHLAPEEWIPKFKRDIESGRSMDQLIASFERNALSRAFERHGSWAKVAKKLGIPKSTLYQKIYIYDLSQR